MQRSTDKKGSIGVKRVIGLAMVFMLIGTATELYLLDHYEDAQQLIPILAIGASLLVMCFLVVRRTKITEGLFKLVMFLTALTGVYGVFLHLKANYEFEREMKPAAGSWDLFTESLSGALPLLAPTSLIAFALIGFAYYLLIKHQQ